MASPEGLAFVWTVDVRDPSTVPGGSTTFLVEVTTNLADYGEHGEPVEAPAASGGSSAPPPPVEPELLEPLPDGDDGAEPSVAPSDAGSAEDAAGGLGALSLAATASGASSASASASAKPREPLVPPRRIAVRRTFSEFVALRDALLARPASAAAGAAGSGKPPLSQPALPPLPGKQLFGSASAETVAARAAAFRALLAACGGLGEGLCAHEALLAFLSSPVAKPDYGAVRAEALARMRAVLALPASSWRGRYDKNGIAIDFSPVPGSLLYLIRSAVTIALPVARVRQHYTHTPNWRLWTPDATFSLVEAVVPGASAVLQVLYRLPVVSNRDVCIFETQLEAGAGGEGVRGAHTAVAMSVDHPLCPKRRGVVRARLLISVTCFEGAAGEGGAAATRVTSWQHADPRGQVPPQVVNTMIVRGKTQLKNMRKVMEEQLK